MMFNLITARCLAPFFMEKKKTEEDPMKCTTVRNGEECVFMSKNGCTYAGGACLSVVEKCTGCARSKEYQTGWYCSAAPNPALKWKNGDCNLATHITVVVKEQAKINPLKASKRGGK